jgi:phospholipase C
MAMSGATRIDTNKTPMPDQPLVYDWLTERGIRWRVDHQTLPFFALMPRWIDDILAGDRFRPFERLGVDIAAEGPDEFPQVVFIEPAYTSAPHLGESTDDHAPTAIKGGQKFLFEVYRDITAVRSRWEHSVTIVTYDEHGGFFDHVSPPAQETRPPADAAWDDLTPFTSLGVRVPALVVSPFVEPGKPHHGTFDHTSILKLLGTKFGGGSYSPEVDARGVGNVADVLRDAADTDPPPPAPSIGVYLNHPTPPAGFTPGKQPEDEMEEAFQDGLDRIRDHPNNPDHLPFNPLLVAFPPKA